MTARHDNGADDPSDPVLDSMRTVWLSMRDEEPPTAGLTDLLAAARAKAEAMQPKPSWWRRALMLLQRPPMLALATSVLLVGGAVLIGGREDLEPALKADEGPKLAQSRAMPESAPAAAPAENQALDNGDDIAKAKDDRAASEPGSETGSKSPSPPPPARPRPARPKPDPAPAKTELEGRFGTDELTMAPTTPADAPANNRPAVKEERERALVIAQDQSPSGVAGGGASSTLPPPPPEADVGSESVRVEDAAPVRTPIRSSADGEPSPTNRIRPKQRVTVKQLADQASTAASRGDCAAVRVIVARIQKMDKTFYKDHVTSNAAVQKCIK